MKTILIILAAVVLVAGLIFLQLAAFRRRHPNAELLIEALKSISGPKQDDGPSDQGPAACNAASTRQECTDGLPPEAFK